MISLLLMGHLVVVVAVPLAMVQPRSLLALRLVNVVRPYVDALSVSHGYAFFGPDPGPSHLVRYELEFADGHVERGHFPDLKQEWPRLWYHRHFMLSEKVAPETPPPPPPAQREQTVAQRQQAGVEWNQWNAQWQQAHNRSLDIATSYAEHLREARGARRVRLYLIEHTLPSPEEVLAGRRLDDPRSYVPLLGTPEHPEPFVTVPPDIEPSAASPPDAAAPEEVPSPGGSRFLTGKKSVPPQGVGSKAADRKTGSPEAGP